MSKRNVTMRDIAESLGVSTVTVSKALGGRDGVSEAVRAQIVQKAKDMGYRYNLMAKSVKEGRSFDVGILIADRFLGENTFYSSLYKKLTLQLSKLGYYGILEILSERDEDGLELPAMVQNSKVDAIIVIGQISPAYIKTLTNVRIPYLFVDFYNEHAGVEAIVSDSIYGTYLLTSYLLQMGHRDIGFVGDIKATSSILDRYLGFYKALLEHGIPLHLEWVVPDRDQRGRFMEVPLPENLPTAFVCNCDETAHRLIRQLATQGIRVPEGLSVVGFDDYLIASLCEPPLTTFRVDQDNMAKLAAEEIISKMNGRSRKNGRIVIDGEVIYRESVKEIK